MSAEINWGNSLKDICSMAIRKTALHYYVIFYVNVVALFLPEILFGCVKICKMRIYILNTYMVMIVINGDIKAGIKIFIKKYMVCSYAHNIIYISIWKKGKEPNSLNIVSLPAANPWVFALTTSLRRCLSHPSQAIIYVHWKIKIFIY